MSDNPRNDTCPSDQWYFSLPCKAVVIPSGAIAVASAIGIKVYWGRRDYGRLLISFALFSGSAFVLIQALRYRDYFDYR